MNELNQNAYVDLINNTCLCGADTLKIRRFNPSLPEGNTPAHWTPMGDGENMKMVTLDANSLEYKDVTAAFIAAFYQKAQPKITVSLHGSESRLLERKVVPYRNRTVL